VDTLTIRNFKCFLATGDVPLRPLTVLVGENSTGKSSFLAAARLAWDLAHSQRRVDFNEEPFLLGAFDQIAHFRGGRAGRAQTFEIGFTTRLPRRRIYAQNNIPRDATVYYGAEFRQTGSHPVIQKQVLRCGEYHFTVEFPEDGTRPKLVIRVGARPVSRSVDEEDFPLRVSPDAPVDWQYVLFSVPELRERGGRPLAEKTSLTEPEVADIHQILRNARYSRTHRPAAIAPVRSRPQRTYNPISETPLPEGEHVPMVLAKTYFESKERWNALRTALDQFGSESGLFSSLDIKPLGRHESDPFQIRVKIEGPATNLVDVGYGVSQVLPVLVDSLLDDRGDFYLLQQPEVHLHPQAQAALGSFFVRLAASESKRFVIETHSDHLIDRIRMDVRDRSEIKPEDVSILFFERVGIEVKIHPIQIDKDGNLVNVPDNYRKFFLNEERRFLGT
jgi:predicted ATPase